MVQDAGQCSTILPPPGNSILVRESLLAGGLYLPRQGASLPSHPFLHPAWHRFGIIFDFHPNSEVASGLLRHPNVMFSFGERSRDRALLKVEVQSLHLAGLGSDVVDGRFGYAIDQQRDTVSAGLQCWVIIMAVGICMNLANFARIFALDADLRALDRLAGGAFDDAAKRGLSLGVGFQH
jgi:hypothetical protein